MRAFLLFLFAAAACRGGEFPELRPRPPWRPDAGLERQQVPWEKLLGNSEIRFLTDNQLSVSVGPAPGIGRLHYYPLRRPVTLSGRLDYGQLARQTQFEGRGAGIEFRHKDGSAAALRESAYHWRPDRVTRTWGNGESQIVEEISVSGNLAAIRLTKVAGPSLKVVIQGSFPYDFNYQEHGAAAVFCFSNGICLAPAVSRGAAPERVKDGYRLVASLDSPVEFIVAAGYTPEAALTGLNRAQARPAAVFAQAHETWDYFFRALVPHFSSANARLDRLYYYLFYVVRSSLFDIPFEPYRHAYTCPWKTGAIWQWTWNTPMNAITERWLNDSSLAKEGIRLIAEHGGSMYFGTYLHPPAPLSRKLDIFEWYQQVDRAQKKLEDGDYDYLSVMPYTVPNSFLGIWEVYLMTGDRAFLEENLPLMRSYEEAARRRARPNSLITPFQMMVDEFDYSLRWKPVQKTFTKGGLQRAFDVPVEMVDVNAYLCRLRQMLADAYRQTGRAPEEAAMRRLADASAAEINRRLWDEERSFYCDARSDTGASTGVRAISGFAPLYAGIVPRNRRPALIRSLDDPRRFGSPYPFPSIELSNPDLDPNLLTYGGDSLITTGVWTVINALVQNGEEARASRYLARAIDMVTKDGVSSSYSYNSIDGRPNQAKHQLSTQCAILNDLIARYVVGLTPRSDGLFEFNPAAVSLAGGHLEFGPFRYRERHWIRVRLDARSWIISIGSASFTLPAPRHVVLRLEPGGKLLPVVVPKSGK